MALGALCLAAVITQVDLRAWLDGLHADFARVGGPGLAALSCALPWWCVQRG
jgi:hypothetical protein